METASCCMISVHKLTSILKLINMQCQLHISCMGIRDPIYFCCQRPPIPLTLSYHSFLFGELGFLWCVPLDLKPRICVELN